MSSSSEVEMLRKRLAESEKRRENEQKRAENERQKRMEAEKRLDEIAANLRGMNLNEDTAANTQTTDISYLKFIEHYTPEYRGDILKHYKNNLEKGKKEIKNFGRYRNMCAFSTIVRSVADKVDVNVPYYVLPLRVRGILDVSSCVSLFKHVQSLYRFFYATIHHLVHKKIFNDYE